jgi:hypothetical protein
MSVPLHRQQGLMPKSQATQADPKHDPRGRMPNDHDQATEIDHPTGEPRTATAMPAANPEDPSRAYGLFSRATDARGFRDKEAREDAVVTCMNARSLEGAALGLA